MNLAVSGLADRPRRRIGIDSPSTARKAATEPQASGHSRATTQKKAPVKIHALAIAPLRIHLVFLLIAR
jgi:hypothetical protein